MKKLGILLMLVLALTMKSHQVFAQSVTIPLLPGWNWISIPMMDTLDFQTAMGSVTPVDGDIIKSHWGSAAYSNGQWRGTISRFYPGYGYHYKSNRAMPVFLTFNAQQPDSQVIVTTADPTDITTNSATCGGIVVSSDVFVILKGICWSTNPNPTFNDNYIEAGNGIGGFSVLMSELASGTTYYVRAFAVTANGAFYGDELSFTTPPEGAIDGLFTINADGDQVYFSQGNLQYIGSASTPYWKFADNQWEFLGNVQNGTSEYNNRDLFGWGTSGYNHGSVCYQPWSISLLFNGYYAYGDYNFNLFDQTGKADWGYNSISNGGNMENQWRTLTDTEWKYVFNSRSTASGIRYVKASVNGVYGVVLLPDNWSSSIYTLNDPNGGDYESNVISLEEWIGVLEAKGAVFLPGAGHRYSTSYVAGDDNFGSYWASTHYSTTHACSIYFNSTDINISDVSGRFYGFAVRLVHDLE